MLGIVTVTLWMPRFYWFSLKCVCFSSSDVWMWKLDYKEIWVPNNWCFWAVVLEKTLESPLDCKEIKPVNPKGNQSWVFLGRTDAEAEAPILWPPDAKNWLFGRVKERLSTGGEGDDIHGWMASPTRWTWFWASSQSWWWTGKPGVLQSMGLQRVIHNWATELNWTESLFWQEVNFSVNQLDLFEVCFQVLRNVKSSLYSRVSLDLVLKCELSWVPI